MSFLQHDLRERTGRAALPVPGASPARDYAVAAAAFLSVLVALHMTALAENWPMGAVLSAALYLAGATLAGGLLRRHYPHGALGVCNLVTLFRLMLTAVLVAPLVLGLANPWIIFGIASVALALDGVDGWAARRQGLASAFGARFDMEVDAALALTLALLAFSTGKAGVVVLFLGLARYAFVLAGLVMQWLAAPLPPSLARKAVCVLQLGTLIVLQIPVVAPPLSDVLAAVASVVLALSFGRDIRWLWRRRG